MYPYDEGQITAFIDDATALYRQAGRTPDPHALIWVARVQFDAFTIGYPASRAKHLAELQQALGLSVTQASNPFHIEPGPLTVDLARSVVFATAKEFRSLIAVYGTDQDASDAAEQLLLRIIWHLHLIGFTNVGRQKNPSGLISIDKFAIEIEGEWHAYDVMSLGYAGRATTVQFVEIGSPNPQPDPGLSD